MSSINASNNIINQHYGKRGVLKSRDINAITNPLGNIMADNGVSVFNTGNGLNLHGSGRLPFDSRLHFGINMVGFIDNDTDWKVTIYRGGVYWIKPFNLINYTEYEGTFTLTAATEYIYIEYNSDDPTATVLKHGDSPPDEEWLYNVVTSSVILYELTKQSDGSYLLDNVYHVGVLYLEIGFIARPFQIGFRETLPLRTVVVRDGYWRYNGRIRSIDGVVDEYKELVTTGDVAYIVLHMELDTQKEADKLVCSLVKEVDFSTFLKDKYEHNYWILGKYDPAALVQWTDEYWKGGFITTIALDNFNDEVDPKPHKKYHHLYIERDANANSHVTIFEFPRLT